MKFLFLSVTWLTHISHKLQTLVPALEQEKTINSRRRQLFCFFQWQCESVLTQSSDLFHFLVRILHSALRFEYTICDSRMLQSESDSHMLELIFLSRSNIGWSKGIPSFLIGRGKLLRLCHPHNFYKWGLCSADVEARSNRHLSTSSFWIALVHVT